MEDISETAESVLYLLSDSAHPVATKKSLVASETSRLHRANLRVCDRDAQLEFFKAKLYKRGYTREFVQPIIELQCRREESRSDVNRTLVCYYAKLKQNPNTQLALQRRHVDLHGRLPSLPVRKFYLKQKFSTTLNIRFLQKALTRHSHLPERCFDNLEPKILVSYSVQQNRFRRHYHDNWFLQDV